MRPPRSRLPILIAATLLLASCLLGVGSSANAAISPCGPVVNDGSMLMPGGTPWSSAIFGFRSYIQYSEPQLCGGDTGPSLSSAWVMVQPQSWATQPGVAHMLAQAGYIKIGRGEGISPAGVHFFSEWNQMNGQAVLTLYGTLNSGNHKYQVFRGASDHVIHMNVDSTQINQTNYSPDSPNWSPNWAGTVAGETIHLETDIPGTASAPVTFTGIAQYDVNQNQTFYNDSRGFNVQKTQNRYQMYYNPYNSSTGYTVYMGTDPLYSY